MLGFFKRRNVQPKEELAPLEIPLTNIKEVDQAGILYVDSEGTSANLHYFDAYKGWRRSKCIKRSKPKYICDQTKSEGWKLIFYTNPKITFYADQSKEELWIEIINKITLHGYRTFDWD